MKKILSFCVMLFGSYFGWWIGAKLGLMVAVILSSIGAGIGLYYGRRLSNNLLG